jgi:ABC-type multidrug transport system ATPase subunit
MIEIRDLRVDFDKVRALNNVSLKVGAGEVLGLVGPNGAGKTTLFRAVLGLIDPSAGSVLVDGIDVASNPDGARRKIGFMPDFSPLYEQL